MSKVLIPNIIITRDYDAMTSIFSADKYIGSSKLKSDNKLFFLSANKNKYLTSFEYNLDFRSKGEKFFKINFIDTDGNFESQFLDSSFIASIATNLAKKLSSFEDVAEAITTDPNFHGYFYIAFGIGEDLSNWSEPHVCEFRGAEIQIDANGRRLYSFNFVPSNDPIFRRQFIYNTNSVNYQGDFSFLDKLKYILNVQYETKTVINEQPYQKVGEMIRNLLINYLKSSCDTENVLVLLPEIDTQIINLVDRYDRTTGKWIPDFLYYKDFIYSKIFGLELITNTGVPQPIQDLKKKTRDYIKNLNSTTKLREYRSRLSAYKVELNNFKNIVSDIQLKLDDFYPRRISALKNILSSLGYDPEAKFTGEAPFSDGYVRAVYQSIRDTEADIERERETIKSYETSINKLNTQIFNLELAIEDILTPLKLNGKQVLAGMLIDATKNITGLDVATIDYMKEFSTKLLENLEDAKSYILKFQEHQSRKSSITPNTFDWYQCLNRVFAGIGTVLGLDQVDSVPYLYEETDIKMINLWYKNGLIPNNKQRCVVLGVKSVINNYLYRNSSQFDKKMTTESTIEFKPKYSLENFDYTMKLYAGDYPKQLFDLISKKKNSSAFSENIILDELAVNPSKMNSQPFLKFLGNSNILKLSDTPIFMNNLKNSNVRSIDVKNLESYYGFMNFNIKDDFTDDLILNAKSLYEKSNIRAIVRKDFESLILDVVKRRIELSKSVETYTVGNTTVTNPLNPSTYLFDATTQVLSKETRQTYNKLLEKIQEKKHSTDEAEYSYKTIFASLGREVGENIDSASRDLFDSDDKIAQEVESLSIFIDALFTIGKIKLSGDKPTLTICDRNGLPTEKNTKAALFHYLYTTTSPTITIRTLPFFHLSNNRTIIGKTAILLSKKTFSQISPINYQLNNLENALDFFSGVYNIIGAKHVITSNDCYSEFVMQKLIGESIT